MTVETRVEFHAFLEAGSLHITADSVETLKGEMKAAGIPLGELKKIQDKSAMGMTAIEADAEEEKPEPKPKAADKPKAEPEKEPEKEPEPQFTEADVRKPFEAIIQSGSDAQFVVELLIEYGAVDSDNRPKVTHLKPEHYGAVIEKANAKLAEIENRKTSAGGVL